LTGFYEIEDEAGNSYIWDDEYQVFIGEDGEELPADAFEYDEGEYEYADPEDEWDEAMASGVADLQTRLGRSLTGTELEGVVGAAEQLGTVDVPNAYAAFRGAGGNVPSEDRQEAAKIVGAPDTSTAEGRTALMSEIASDIQAQQDEEGADDGGEGG
jgi:hypothetical protein